MFNDALRYVFWILLSLPVLALGIYFFANITGVIYKRLKIDKKKQEERELQKIRRREFEESYSRRRGGR